MAGRKRLIVTLALVTAICFAVVGVTLAYYQGQTSDAKNQFMLGTVDVEVPEIWEEPQQGTSKKEVRLKNTGTVDAYLRALIVPMFRSNGQPLPGNADYSRVLTDGTIAVTTADNARTYTLYLAADWQKDWQFSTELGNVFMYRYKVAPEGLTTPLLQFVKTVPINGWEELNVEILADAIQSEGSEALAYLKDQWGINRIGGDGTLVW